MKMLKIGIIVGSTRKNAYSKAIARALTQIMPANAQIIEIEISKLPLYCQDYDMDYPAAYLEFKEQIQACHGLVFITPEHNRSTSAALKNAIDIGSRPYGANVWTGKPAAVISQSTGAIGGFGANQHLRQICACVGLNLMLQPECYIGSITDYLDQKGNIANRDTLLFLQDFAQSFYNWIKRFL